MKFDMDVQKIYALAKERVSAGRKKLGRPLALSEKIFMAHAAHPEKQSFERGKSYLELYPDRVAMQDATAQMAMLQFMSSGRGKVAVPATIHCDHLIQARVGAEKDLKAALVTNKEVFDFLMSASMKYGIGFWKPGAGIIHQVILENYAFPGALMIGTDSHTPNAGGLGMMAIGVGGADAVDVMAGMAWEVKCPKLVGIKLAGKLSGWTAAKDVILKLCGMITTKGGTDKILEYFGPGTRSISATGKATITNMGAELGATTSIFPFDERMSAYLRATKRREVVELAEKHKDLFVADPEVENSPEKFYDEIIEIDLSTLEPYIVGPHTPDLARPISELAKDAKEKGYDDTLRVALIGSCTNSSYEDIGRAAHIARQARKNGLKVKSTFMITPGSDQIYHTIERDGQLKDLVDIGGTVLANACGPCIGQWKRDDIKSGQQNSIITSFNRNFARRNDGNAETMAFIGSPELVTAMALAGSLSFNPLKDALADPKGGRLHLTPPESPELPSNGFASGEEGFVPPSENGASVQVIIDPKSERLEKLEPFEPWDGKDFENLFLLVKVKGKCTTDHISPAGPWLRYRGHLNRISDNMFLGAVNAFTGKSGEAKDLIDGEIKPIPEVARHYKSEGKGWAAVGDLNYGEGSSREHAAMSPRFLGAKTIIARSFARIHETNLKKQGILPLIFKNPSDYEKIQGEDRLSIRGLRHLKPGSTLEMVIHHKDKTADKVELLHSLTDEQIGWFKAGSALNILKRT
ncbi:MAG: aconitate hydratase [Candidatus Omnitrophica bacterium]|nr:aconitate hydratase [Candidatus Omnitrophota bacterium]